MFTRMNTGEWQCKPCAIHTKKSLALNLTVATYSAVEMKESKEKFWWVWKGGPEFGKLTAL